MNFLLYYDNNPAGLHYTRWLQLPSSIDPSNLRPAHNSDCSPSPEVDSTEPDFETRPPLPDIPHTCYTEGWLLMLEARQLADVSSVLKKSEISV